MRWLKYATEHWDLSNATTWWNRRHWNGIFKRIDSNDIYYSCNRNFCSHYLLMFKLIFILLSLASASAHPDNHLDDTRYCGEPASYEKWVRRDKEHAMASEIN